MYVGLSLISSGVWECVILFGTNVASRTVVADTSYSNITVSTSLSLVQKKRSDLWGATVTTRRGVSVTTSPMLTMFGM